MIENSECVGESRLRSGCGGRETRLTGAKVGEVTSWGSELWRMVALESAEG